MENIKTFEDACAVLGYDAANIVPDFSLFPETDRKAMEAHAKLVIVAKALNGDWTPDWSNGKWDKFYPWFYMDDSSGSGFSAYGCDYDLSVSTVGSRLCFKSRELAQYAGKQFESLYKEYFLLN